MGSVLSSITDSPISTDFQIGNSSNATMTSSSDSKTQVTPQSTNSSIETKPTKESDQETKPPEQNPQKDQEAEGDGEGEGEDEEEGECGFCLFMKGGGCRDAFIDWENCVKEADRIEEDVVNKCFEATAALRRCMQAHADYYEPILKAEKYAEEKAMKELEKEKALEKEESESKLVNNNETDKKVTVDSSDAESGQ